MSIQSLRFATAASLALAFASGCAGASAPQMPAQAQQTAQHPQLIHHDALVAQRLSELSRTLMAASRKQEKVVLASSLSNIHFEDANCKALTEDQASRYIDPSITGEARRTALRYMLAEPACARSNVEGIDRGPYSNTREGMQEVEETYTDWTLDGDGTYSDSSGDEIVATDPGPDAALAGTGAIYKYNATQGYSAVSGMIQIPNCGWINNVAAKNTPYLLFGGTPVGSSNYVDAGFGWNNPSQTVQLYYQDSDLNTKPLGGNYKYPCTLAGSRSVFLKITLGITVNKTATTNPQFFMQALSYYSDGSAGPYPNSHIGNIAVNRNWSISCAACMMKREFNIAQMGTNANSGTNFAMEDSFQSGTPIQETRTPLQPYVNFTVGSYPGRGYTSAGYLWVTSSPVIMPAAMPSQLKLLTFLGPNNGTETPGMLLQKCQTSPATNCMAAPGAALP